MHVRLMKWTNGRRRLALVLAGGVFLLAVVGVGLDPALWGQDAAAPPAEPAAVPAGVEVQARGPVHEAYADLTADPQPTQLIPKHPPEALQEMPPEEKPDGDVVWIPGYWQWDDDRKDFLWVSGIWRVQPPGKRWVAGYWRDVGDQSQWVPGFWTAVEQDTEATSQVTYLPQPPAPPQVSPPGAQPAPDTFYVPGSWVWNGNQYAWRAGYWARVQPGYVWVAAHYRWTPTGYVYIPGYWDLAVADRGFLYAPVYISPAVVTVGFVYTPAYCVSDTVVVDALFVRPCCCHYYFGDYYGPAYADGGFVSCAVYSRSHYDGIFVYAAYEHRDEPNWVNVQVNLSNDRYYGRAPVPPRTLVQQTTIVNNVTNINNRTVNRTEVLMPARKLAAARGISVVKLDQAARAQVQQQARAIQQVAYQRHQGEVATPGGTPTRPRTASLHVPKAQPVAAHPAPGTRPSSGRKLGVPAAAAHASHPAGGTATNHPANTYNRASTATPNGYHPANPQNGYHPSSVAPPGYRGTTNPYNPAAPGMHPGMAPGTYPPGAHPPGQPGQPGQKPPPYGTQRNQADPNHRPPPKDGRGNDRDRDRDR
jgi:hypothetical protein